MIVLKAILAFLKVLLGGGECEHPRVDLNKSPSYCPTCGCCIKLEWVFTLCRGCNARRIPQQSILGQIRPVHQFCRHCGAEGFKHSKKVQINNAYEMMYAIAVKSIVYEEERSTVFRNPFQTSAYMDDDGVVEAEVVCKREFKMDSARNAFRAPPFDWQTTQNPNRYGGSSDGTYGIRRLRRLT